MRTLAIYLLLCASAFGQSVTVTVQTNGTLRFPTTLFSANSNSLNASILRAWSAITGKPTTLSGYGITDAQATNAVLTALQALTSGSAGMVVTATGPGTFALSNITSGSSWTLTVRGSGSVTNITDGAGITNVVSGGDVTPTLLPSGVASGSYGVFGGTVDTYGRLTAATNVPTPKFLLTIGYQAASSLTSNTTYYVAKGASQTWSQSTTYTNGSIIVPFKSRLIGAHFRIRSGTQAAPTGSNILFYITKNATTDTPVLTNAIFDIAQATIYQKTDPTLSGFQFAEGDYIGVKYATPAWWSTVPNMGGMVDLCFEAMP